MKIKNIAAALVAVMCIGLAGCGDQTSEEATTSAEITSAETSETTEASLGTEASEDIGDTGPEEGEGTENPLQPIADAGLAVGEWPALWEVDDDMILEDFFLLDANNEN
ncbi:MAG: hypothetical protein J1E40_12335, partial [Oscillospiraceae bacterium]|nr:hypothetical protein [Oscillospiraceae bacterium]